ncbi:hypothetical protein [Polaromonas sp.]|uniref:hypothetical protein n=1 Tax=Polaromonas sp. TaxID=1869339 RepID=UPI00352A5BCE
MRLRGFTLRLLRTGLAAAFLLASSWVIAQVCATPQKDGSKTSSAGEVVNGYYTPANGSYPAGTQPTIALSNARGTTTVFAPGDMALLIQMQCADMNLTDTDSYGDGVAGFPAFGYIEPPGSCKAGQHEYVPAGPGTTPASFVAGAALQNTYVQADPTISSTRRSFQIVRVPQYASLTLGGQLNGVAWNGLNGGVIALDVAKNTNFAGQTISLAAQGFRGAGGRPSGAVDGNNPYRYNDGPGQAHAGKGEGIAGTPPLLFTDGTPFDRSDTTGTVTLNVGSFYGYPGNTGALANFNYAKAAPGNAGGGGVYRDGTYHNGGGGGGGNGGAGGRGGFGWRSAGWAGVASDYANIVAITGDHLAAFGGSAFGAAGVSRVTLGGGGGAGDQNGNSNNTREMSGGTGGGIVLMRSGSLSGGGTIDVRGGVANTNPLNDGAGGGAAGGSSVIISPNWTSGALTINAGGGQAGDAWLSGTGGAHSGGGGGGGGVSVRSGAALVDVSGGANGITNTSDSPPGGPAHGAFPGNNGLDQLISESSDPVSNSGYKCLPQTDLYISKSAGPASLSVGQTTTFTLTIGNSGPQQATAASVLDALPAGLGALAFVSATGTSAATTLTASSIAGLNTFTATITVPANQTLTILLRATASSNGAPVNSASVAAPANASDPNLANNTGTATVVIGPGADLAATKVASTPSLALGQTTTFTLTYVNNGPAAVTGATLRDTLPSGLGTLTFVSASIAGGSTLTSRLTSSTAFSGTATLPVASTLTVVLQAVAGTAGSFINTTTVAPPAGTTDTDPSNNTGMVTVNIGPQADLGISKSATPTVIQDGQTTVFTITIRNAGPNAATGATVRDTLPSGLFGLVLLGASSSGGGTLTASALTSTQFNGTLTLPASSSVTLQLRATAGAVGTQVNQATVTAPAGVIDPTPGNNTAQASVTVPVSTNLSVGKTNGVTTLPAGSTTSYTVMVNNGGPYSADNSVLTDPPIAGLSCTAVSCNASGGAVCPGPPVSLTALQGSGLNLPTLPAGSNLTFTLTCGVTATGL